ncbi:hypothetical protein TanjilG_28710 [Lupinus angustifolius]|uniref:Uncharacterized protein n=1 Tax=Lupinus angustifolius TaxID=3871 RepID=A0A394DCN4_LUPAN|nr:hypothetical protein TanjilG_28710 [Lupinus angustifolius]
MESCILTIRLATIIGYLDKMETELYFSELCLLLRTLNCLLSSSPDFLILFFTEAIFYGGVAVFLFQLDHLSRPTQQGTNASNNDTLPPQLIQRVSSVSTMVLSLIIPMVTMGLVWPWTGPAASATLAPYLVGILVQFAFEQYARHRKSPSWSAIPLIFQVRTIQSPVD